MSRRHRPGRYPVALLLALLAGGAAHAAGCTVTSSGMAFGAYHPLTFAGRLNSGPATSDASVVVACTGMVGGGTYQVTLGPSAAGTGDRINTRYLAGPPGGEDMAFNVYLDPAYTTIWGDGITAGSVVTGSVPPGDSSATHIVYGRVPAGQNKLMAGAYAGWLTMTVTYSP